MTGTYESAPPPVLDECDLPARQVVARGAAGQAVELPHQVAVVGVPAGGGHVGDRPVRSDPQLLGGPPEPQDAGGRLGGQPDLGPEPGAEVAAAPADLL